MVIGEIKNLLTTVVHVSGDRLIIVFLRYAIQRPQSQQTVSGQEKERKNTRRKYKEKIFNGQRAQNTESLHENLTSIKNTITTKVRP